MKTRNEEIENRIYDEIVVDCYDDEEQKMGWYYYMEEKIHFPFIANVKRKKRNGEFAIQKVEVLELTSTEDFGKDLKVGVCYSEDIFNVPLLSLTNIEATDETLQAIEDWRYWNS